MKNEKLIQDVIVFIMTRSDEELAVLTVERLSDVFQIGRSKLARKFKYYKAVTLEFYLCREKLIRAAFLLVYQGDISIQQIAERMGFCSSGYFSQVFEKFFGVKPCNYREYRKVRAGIKDRRIGLVDRRENNQPLAIGIPDRRKSFGDRRKGVKDRRVNNFEPMPIIPFNMNIMQNAER